ncbi:hypothetical protein FB107DRAFT_251319 [Schizophyllum commune]
MLEKEKTKNLQLQRQNDRLQGDKYDKPYESEDETVSARKAKKLTSLYASSTTTRVGSKSKATTAASEFVKLPTKKSSKPKLIATSRKAMYSVIDNRDDDAEDELDIRRTGSPAPIHDKNENVNVNENENEMEVDFSGECQGVPGVENATQHRAPLGNAVAAPASQIISSRTSVNAPSGGKHARKESLSSAESQPSKRACAANHKDTSKKAPAGGAASAGHCSSNRPKAGDYDEDVNPVIIRAAREYEARIFGKGAFPESFAQGRLACLCLCHASRALDVPIQYSHGIGRVLKIHGSTVRGKSIAIVRKHVETMYGFKHSENGRPLASNTKHSEYLLEENRYMHKDPAKEDEYLAEHKIIPRVLQEVILPQGKGTASMGVVHRKLFDPVSIDTLALIFSQVRHCIMEWSSGKREQKDYTEKEAQKDNAFAVILKVLHDWVDADPEMTQKIRAKIFKKAKNLSNVEDKTAAPVKKLSAEHKRRIAAHLAARTGDTDSEDEDGNDGGKNTFCSKLRIVDCNFSRRQYGPIPVAGLPAAGAGTCPYRAPGP